MNSKVKLYISIPISGHDMAMVKTKAAKLKERLTSGNCEVITPFDVCDEPGRSYSYYMGRDIEALLECDAIFMAHGWESSKGCLCEHSTANIYGLKIFYQSDCHANQVQYPHLPLD